MFAGKCNWCLRTKALVTDKKYCEECRIAGQECKHCKRPMPAEYYKHSQTICNACFNRAENAKQRRKIATSQAVKPTNNQHGGGMLHAQSVMRARTPQVPPVPPVQATEGHAVAPTHSPKAQPAEPTQAVSPPTSRKRKASDSPQASTSGQDRQPGNMASQARHRSPSSNPPNQQASPQRSPRVNQALQSTAMELTYVPQRNDDILMAMHELERDITDRINYDRIRHRGVKWYLSVAAQYSKVRPDGEIVTTEIWFNSTTMISLEASSVEGQVAEVYRHLHSQSQEFQSQGSGWSLDHVINLRLYTIAYQPLRGSSYIDLPQKIKNSRSVLNIVNNDDKCILWCILAHKHPVDRSQHPQRVAKYRDFEHELNMAGVSYPTPLSDIKRIEDQNAGISITVLGYEKESGFYPLRRTKAIKATHVRLLLIKDGEKSHYCLIKDLSRLLNSLTGHNGRAYYCENCLHGFTRQDLLDDHSTLCYQQKVQSIQLPKEGEVLQFEGMAKQLRVPFVIYADFECYTTKLDTCMQNPQASNTTRYQRHDVSGFAYMVVCTAEEHTMKPVVYRGPNVIKTFYDKILAENTRIQAILNNPKPMIVTPQQQREFDEAQDCYICGEPLGVDRVRDHDHLTGNYRGAAHKACNINYRWGYTGRGKSRQYTVPVVFHNLRGYDGHLLMEALGRHKERQLQCIPNNTERYISFSLANMRFIDSLQFLSASLDHLVSNLTAEGKGKFKHLLANISDSAQQDALLRKGVYPYDFMDAPSKMQEQELPSPDSFYNQLNNEPISAEDYAHAQNVWQLFGCSTMGDYHDIYLQSDVLLLADVFESFRDMTQVTYGLDPAHYYTTPGLSWDSMLKQTKVKLELLHDVDMYLMIESGIRGGVSVITRKHAQANNPYVEGYNPEKPRDYLMYLDANNLYGWAMSQKLPESDFTWMSAQEIEQFDVNQVQDDSETGYILDVDLEYPHDLHDLHSDMPLAPENKTIADEELSPYTRQLKEELNIRAKPCAKLIPNLHDKTRYIVHYANLRQYLGLGMRLKRIHRGVSFHQSFWLKEYITLNTEKRKVARNAFEKDFFKLMNNSIFGKTMENVRGRVDMELVHTPARMRRVATKPCFHKMTIFNADLVAAQCLKTQIKLNKPVYVGFSILDLSKTLMYEFHYRHIKELYGERARLCFTDTDSLLYAIKTEDIYEDMLSHADRYDTSDYPPEHPLHSNTNKKVLGKMKDETAGKPISEFVGLRAKMYSFKCGGVEKKTAKGIKRATIRQTLKHAMYKDALYNNQVSYASMKTIRSYRHKLFSIAQNKQALSPFDDKRYVLQNKVITRAHGHYRN